MDKISNKALDSLTRQGPSENERLPVLSQTALTLRSNYGSGEAFLELFKPDYQDQVMKHIDRAFIGTAPRLRDLAECYSENFVIAWILVQLENLNDYCGTTRKMNIDQMATLSKLIVDNYPNYKVTQLMVFFNRFKIGQYCKFYDSVDPMAITKSLRMFDVERREEIGIYMAEAEAKAIENKRAYWKENAISREEYERRISINQPKPITDGPSDL